MEHIQAPTVVRGVVAPIHPVLEAQEQEQQDRVMVVV
jgi:hypothetical protein